jgi:hypothetical protein
MSEEANQPDDVERSEGKFDPVTDPTSVVRGKTCTKRATLLRVLILRSTDTREVPQIKQFIRKNYRLILKILLDLGRVARFV